MTRLAAARRLVLYLLSLLAVAGAQVAWGLAGPGRLLLIAAALALTLVLGEVVADTLSGLETAWRRGARLGAVVVYPVMALGAVSAAVAGGELAARASTALSLLQLLLFVVAELLGLRAVLLANLLLLVIITVLAGGLPAAAAAVGTVGLIPCFLTFDRLASRLAAVPAGHVPITVARTETRETVRLVAPIVLLLAGYFLWAPPAPLSSQAAAGGMPLPSETRDAYRWLTVMALFGGGLVTILTRLLRGRGEPATTLVDDPETFVVAEEDLEPRRLDDARYGPGRGRVILAYLRFLARARELGNEIGVALTPREIEGRVPGPATPLAVLTGAFMDARYGPDEPSLEGIRVAEAASRELRDALPRSAATRTGAPPPGRGRPRAWPARPRSPVPR